MSIFRTSSKAPKPPPQLSARAEAALRGPIERLKRGEAGLKLDEVANTLDQLVSLPPEELRLARQLIIDADAAALKLFHGDEDDPTRGQATPERIIRLLSGEEHGLAPLPTSAAAAAYDVPHAAVEAMKAQDVAVKATKRLDTLTQAPTKLSVSQQEDFESIFAAGRRLDERDALKGAQHALASLRPGGAAVLSPRTGAAIAEPLGEGRPSTLHLMAALLNGKPALEARDVPALLDKLLDLNPFELKQLRRALAPTKDFDARYAALGDQNPLAGITTPEKIVQMLAGVGEGKPALPTTASEARELEQEDLEKSLASVTRPTPGQSRSFIFDISVRSGVKGVFSFGWDEMFGRTAVDRQTHRRSWQHFHQVFVRTPATINSYTWGKEVKGNRTEVGVNAPYVYGTVGNPLLGPRAGIFIPLVASSTISANGTVGLGIVLNTPVPLLHIGITAYLTDPRLLKFIDPALEAVQRASTFLKPVTQPLADAWENLVHKVKAPKDAPTVDWSVKPSRAQGLKQGETVSVSGPTALELEGHRVEVALAPGVSPANVQLRSGEKGLELFLDGQAHALPTSGGKTRIVIGDEQVWVQLDGDKGMQVER